MVRIYRRSANPAKVVRSGAVPSPTDPIAYLRRLHRAGSHNDVVQMIRDRDHVLARYGPIFSRPERLDEDTMLGFLEFENNRHWWNLRQHAPLLAGRASVVREVLGELQDDSTTLADRVDGVGDVPGLEPAVWSAMLLMAAPDTYGVWNPISEAAMRRLGLWPDEDGSTGATYAALNEMLAAVADEVDTDRWTLDALWWAAEKEHDPTKHFVTRREPVRSGAPRRGSSAPPKRRSTARSSKRAKAAATADTFVCSNCWTTKPARLDAGGGVCVDCA